MNTYHSWSGVGDLSLEWDPLIVGPLFVSEGPQEGSADVVHGVETDGRASENTAAANNGDTSVSFQMCDRHTISRSTFLKQIARPIQGLWGL